MSVTENFWSQSDSLRSLSGVIFSIFVNPELYMYNSASKHSRPTLQHFNVHWRVKNYHIMFINLSINGNVAFSAESKSNEAQLFGKINNIDSTSTHKPRH